MKLRDRVAMVTATGGSGRCHGPMLAGLGAKTLVNDIIGARATRVAEELAAARPCCR